MADIDHLWPRIGMRVQFPARPNGRPVLIKGTVEHDPRNDSVRVAVRRDTGGAVTMRYRNRLTPPLDEIAATETVGTKRKPIQIAAMPAAGSTLDCCFVLCDDGSMWVLEDPTSNPARFHWHCQWRRLPAVPGSAEERR